MKPMKLALAAAASLGLLLSGCGNYVGLGGTNPSPSPSPSVEVTVTEQDHATTLRSGQRLELILHAPNGMSNWSSPKSSDPTVLAPVVDPRATAAVGVTLAAFAAVRPGTAEVTATASPKCPPNAVCPMYVALYSLKVTVTP